MSSAGAAASAAVDLRPLGMGELVDRSASLWKRHAGAFFRLHLGFSLGLYALAKALLLAISRWAPTFRGGGQALGGALAAQSAAMQEQLPAALGLMGGFSIVYAWLNWVGWVATSDYAIGAWLGRPVTVEGSLKRALKRTGATTGAFAVAVLYAIAATVAFMLPGIGIMLLPLVTLPSSGVTTVTVIIGAIIMFFGMLVAVVWCILRFLLTCQVLAIEDLGGVQAIRRSGALIAGRIGAGFFGWVKVRATVLITVVFLLLLTVTFVTGIPAMIVQALYGNILDPANATPDAVPQALLVPAELIQVLGQSLFSPLYIAFAGLFYADMRVRREGLDLELALDREGA